MYLSERSGARRDSTASTAFDRSVGMHNDQMVPFVTETTASDFLRNRGIEGAGVARWWPSWVLAFESDKVWRGFVPCEALVELLGSGDDQPGTGRWVGISHATLEGHGKADSGAVLGLVGDCGQAVGPRRRQYRLWSLA